jgi:hypothetical protein
MDDESAGIQTVAEQIIARRGEQAVDDLLEMAEIAAGNGDEDSAQTWREIAAAAQALLNSHRQL